MGSITSPLYSPTDASSHDTQLGNSTDGCILLHNLSQYELYVSTPDNDFKSFVGAWSWRRFDLTDPTPMLVWMVAAQPIQANPPLSAVFIETYTAREQAPPQYFGTYTRQTNVGNQVSTASSGANIVDGQPLGTTVTEATPSGQSTSFIKILNDGTLLIACLSNNVVTDIIQITPGGAATPASAVLGSASNGATTTLHGTADKALSVPAAGIVGSVPSTQTIDGTNSGSLTTPQIQSGTAGAGVSIKNGAGITEIYPTSPAATAETIQLDYQDAAGALHAGPHLRTDNNTFNTPGQFEHSTNDNYILGASFQGTGAGTYSHFFRAKTPTWVAVTSNETNSTETVGIDSLGSSTVHVNMPNNWPFVAVAGLC